jgi:hypothetical protein
MMLLVSTALAAGLHAGIPVRGVPGVGEPSFVTPEMGWTASVQGGWVRVYVGRTEADGDRWFTDAIATLQVAPPPFRLGDEAVGDGQTLVGFRDGNVAVLVRAESGAGAVAQRLHAAILDKAPTIAAPSLRHTDEGWVVDAPGAVAVSVEGGRKVPFKADVWREAPTTVIAWDSVGRPYEARR